jgi:hypothetical protein
MFLPIFLRQKVGSKHLGTLGLMSRIYKPEKLSEVETILI